MELSEVNSLIMYGKVNLAAAKMLLADFKDTFLLRGWHDVFWSNNRLKIIKELSATEEIDAKSKELVVMQKELINEYVNWMEEHIRKEIKQNKGRWASELAVARKRGDKELKLEYSKIMKLIESDSTDLYGWIKTIEMS